MIDFDLLSDLLSSKLQFIQVFSLIPTRIPCSKTRGAAPSGKSNMEQVDSKVDSKATRKARLTQYRKNAGTWQFYAVARNLDGKPTPE
jgi:hypothetical protein